MIRRQIFDQVVKALGVMPVVALLGARQVGKTTLALEVSKALYKKTTYLDLELDSDLNKLSDPESFLSRFQNELLIIDEVQRKPDLFRVLRSIIDRRKREGEGSGQFLILGSASKELLQHTSESLAGRIRYLELTPFSIIELLDHDPTLLDIERLWFRGGFPDSYLAIDDVSSWNWRNDFISTYVERDIPTMGAGVSPSQLKKFWTMLAHYHGQQVVLSELGRSLEVSHTTIRNYLDLLTDFYMVRQLTPWSGNIKKRLVKSPKIYIRDTGLLHKLLQVSSFDVLLGHPSIGASWEGFVVENIINLLDSRWNFSYFRTSTQTEIDLVLQTPNNEIWAIEIKRSSAPKLGRGIYDAFQDVKATHKWIINAGSDQYPLPNGVEVIGLVAFLQMINLRYPIQ